MSYPTEVCHETPVHLPRRRRIRRRGIRAVGSDRGHTRTRRRRDRRRIHRCRRERPPLPQGDRFAPHRKPEHHAPQGRQPRRIRQRFLPRIPPPHTRTHRHHPPPHPPPEPLPP